MTIKWSHVRARKIASPKSNRYRVDVAIELEPVNAFHRKRMMCAKRVAVETEYFNGCGALNMRTNANAMTCEINVLMY